MPPSFFLVYKYTAETVYFPHAASWYCFCGGCGIMDRMKTLLSLPVNLLKTYKDICRPEQRVFFTASDPAGTHLGSGGGTAWILSEFNRLEQDAISEKKILIHAGGQGRRLPSYSAAGKIFTPIPVYKWKTGQKIDQTLLDIQMEFYNGIMERSRPSQKLLVASGDVLLRCSALPSELPEADVVVLTTWIDSSIATRHGVVFARHETPDVMDFMLQKPSTEKIEELVATHVFMMDTGCWILSDKAVEVLMNKCRPSGKAAENWDGVPLEYDFYTDFGGALGKNPVSFDEAVSSLTCAVVNLEDGEFYHYGTTRELISSTEKIQNLILNPRSVLNGKVKVQSSVFVQNAITEIDWTPELKNVWIENSTVGKGWHLEGDNVITGVPSNSWNLTVPKGACIDVEPVGDDAYVIRVYGMDDPFRGAVSADTTKWLGKPAPESAIIRQVLAECEKAPDLQYAPIFPVIKAADFETEGLNALEFLLYGQWNRTSEADCFLKEKAYHLISADEILSGVNIVKLFSQRDELLRKNLPMMAANYRKSVFYQCDLTHTKQLYSRLGLELPRGSVEGSPVLRMRHAMLTGDERGAFSTLEDAILDGVSKVNPQFDLIIDQIAWGRSPARIDLAGGWSDTPPYSIYNGGAVVNIAIDLNGQQPIQAYVRMIRENKFVLRSIDTGVREEVSSWQELEAYNQVGSSFCIPKAALCLAGFSRRFCTCKYKSLEDQLKTLGGGLEITTLAAIPKGSGLGTSSIIASTLLGTLSNVCGLKWTEQEICFRTLALEQLLTTGGGWQDQYGGVYGGIKLCTSESGIQNNVQVRRLPTNVITDTENSSLWLLYYSGITRVAKNILSDIVRNMFLNKGETLACDDEIRHHGLVLADAIQFCQYERTARMIKTSWNLNRKLDSGVTTPEIEKVISRIDDYALGYKLAGAGGGGYMLICAKDLEAAARIKQELNGNPPNERARFVGLTLNSRGLEITRS